MSGWADGELEIVGDAEEIDVASQAAHGNLRHRRTIWVVRVDDDLYVRSVNGTGSDWYRATRAEQRGQLWAGSVVVPVAFVDVEPGINPDVDRAYRDKYQRYAASILDHITSPPAGATTTRLQPRPSESERN